MRAAVWKKARGRANLFLEPRDNSGLTHRPYERFVPPHPGPLPQGEGERWRRIVRIGAHPYGGRLRKKPITEPKVSLSLRERAGVRGNGPPVSTRAQNQICARRGTKQKLSPPSA